MHDRGRRVQGKIKRTSGAGGWSREQARWSGADMTGRGGGSWLDRLFKQDGQLRPVLNRRRFHVMNPLLRSVNWAAKCFNYLPFWQGECTVWEQRMKSANFERWLYLRAHRLGFMGKEERAFLAQTIKPGMRILDVGSNLGLYSIFMARLTGPTGQVTSFEPDASLFQVLQKNCALNGISHLTAHPLALGSARAQLQLHKMLINSGDNHFGQVDSALFREAIVTEVVKLDDHLPDLRVDFVKIDVQGWELEALRGMRDVLAANRDVKIYFEFTPVCLRRAGATHGELFDFFHSLGFRISDPLKGQELDRAALAALADSLHGAHYTNLLAYR
jgi:FkbM family methyltransferase